MTTQVHDDRAQEPENRPAVETRCTDGSANGSTCSCPFGCHADHDNDVERGAL